MRIFRAGRWARLAPLAVAALALSAASNPAGGGRGRSAPASSVSRNAGAAAASRLISEVHAINQSEIMMGQLAQQKGSTAQVRRYGLLLSRDHRLGDEQLLSLARDQHLGVASAGMSPADQATMRRLQGLSGKAFDRQFLADMKKGHDQALAMLKSSRGQLANPAVRDFMGKLIPLLDQHRDLSQHLEGKA